MFTRILDLVFPRRFFTGSSGDFITVEEWNLIPVQPRRERRESLRRRQLASIDCICSAMEYKHSVTVQRAIYTLKYKRIPSMVDRLADLLLKASSLELHRDCVLCPVPLFWTRRFDRGFNQAALLTDRIARDLGLPVEYLLRRTRDTGHQAWRSREERLHAMRDAFAVRKHGTMPRHVVLIDDISTTGATLDACAQALRAAGVTRVDAWVIARG